MKTKEARCYIDKTVSKELSIRAVKLGMARQKYRLFEILAKMPLTELRELSNKYII